MPTSPGVRGDSRLHLHEEAWRRSKQAIGRKVRPIKQPQINSGPDGLPIPNASLSPEEFAALVAIDSRLGLIERRRDVWAPRADGGDALVAAGP